VQLEDMTSIDALQVLLGTHIVDVFKGSGATGRTAKFSGCQRSVMRYLCGVMRP
jgi:hypothetical protein